jgi:hypothetical protein
MSLIAKAGLRPQVLGNYDGKDGLSMKDLPDIVIQQGVARCLRNPPRIIVRKTLSKARHQYFTFLTMSGTKKLLAYLNERLANDEALTAESAVIAPDSAHRYGRGNNGGKRFLPTLQVSKIIRDTLRPRFQWRPYILRAYFDTQLLIAESRGKIAHDFRVFFIGAQRNHRSKIHNKQRNIARGTGKRNAGSIHTQRRISGLGSQKGRPVAEAERTSSSSNREGYS